MDLTAAYNASPVGSRERAVAGASLAEARARLNQDSDTGQTYAPSAAMQSADIAARTHYQVSRDAPWSDGSPGSNPFMATAGMLTQDQRELSAIQATDRTATSPVAHLANQEAESRLQVEMAGLRREQMTAGLSFCPSSSAACLGEATALLSCPSRARRRSSVAIRWCRVHSARRTANRLPQSAHRWPEGARAASAQQRGQTRRGYSCAAS